MKTIAIDKRQGQKCELRLTQQGALYAVGLFPIGSETGICIGVGPSDLSAYSDALETLQAGRWGLHDAILELVKPGYQATVGGVTTVGGSVPATGGNVPRGTRGGGDA